MPSEIKFSRDTNPSTIAASPPSREEDPVDLELLSIEPVNDAGGLAFMAGVRVGPVHTLGWRGTYDRAGKLRIGPPTRVYWANGEKFVVEVIRLPQDVMARAQEIIRAAWETRERGNGSRGDGTFDRATR